MQYLSFSAKGFFFSKKRFTIYPVFFSIIYFCYFRNNFLVAKKNLANFTLVIVYYILYSHKTLKKLTKKPTGLLHFRKNCSTRNRKKPEYMLCYH